MSIGLSTSVIRVYGYLGAGKRGKEPKLVRNIEFKPLTNQRMNFKNPGIPK